MIAPIMQDDYVLLTRARKDSVETQKILENIGIKSLISPSIDIKSLETKMDPLNQYDALLITSKHVVSYLPKAIISNKLPIYSIGSETTNTLLAAGFEVLQTANGSSQSMADILAQSSPHQNILHLGGVHISANFQNYILNQNMGVTHIALYEAVAKQTLPENVIKALQNRQISYVLFYSARSAKIFVSLCKTYGLCEYLDSIQALCLADSVLKSLDKDKWKDVHHAKDPQTSAMIEWLKAHKFQE